MLFLPICPPKHPISPQGPQPLPLLPLPHPVYLRPVVPSSREPSQIHFRCPTHLLGGPWLRPSGPQTWPALKASYPGSFPGASLLSVPHPGCWQDASSKTTTLGLEGLPWALSAEKRKGPNSLARYLTPCTAWPPLMVPESSSAFPAEEALGLGFSDCHLSPLHHNHLGPWWKMQNPGPYPRRLHRGV